MNETYDPVEIEEQLEGKRIKRFWGNADELVIELETGAELIIASDEDELRWCVRRGE